MILWFFLIVTWNGTVEVHHGFKDFETCATKQAQTAEQFRGLVRHVSLCIGLPLVDADAPRKPDRPYSGQTG